MKEKINKKISEKKIANGSMKQNITTKTWNAKGRQHKLYGALQRLITWLISLGYVMKYSYVPFV